MNNDDLNVSGIYKITLLDTGWFYIGSAVHVRSRFNSHKAHLRAGTHCNRYLQKAWKQYGEERFCFAITEVVSDIPTLIAREQYWIDKLEACGPNGFNICPIAGNVLGVRKSPLSVEKTAAAHRGMKRSEETRARIREARAKQKMGDVQRMQLVERMRSWRPSALMIARAREVWIGRKHSPDTIEKLRIAATGRQKTSETLEKLRVAFAGRRLPDIAYERSAAWWRGKKHSQETIEKLRAANTGRTLSTDVRTKISAAGRGKPKPPGFGDKIRAALTGKKHSVERRRNISLSLVGRVISQETIAKRIATRKRNKEATNGRAFQECDS